MKPPSSLCVAPNGARKKKVDIPNLPLSPAELAHEALACQREGATLFHFHVRHDDESHSLDPGRYKEATAEIKKQTPGLVLQASTECCGIYGPDDQIKLVKTLVPEAFSINLTELIPDPSYSTKAAHFLQWAQDMTMVVQYICYSPEEVLFLAEQVKQGVVPQQTLYFFLFVLGRRDRPAQSAELRPFLDTAKQLDLPGVVDWAACAFGSQELVCLLEATRQGGSVRIGFENNHLLETGKTAINNAELVKQYLMKLSSHTA